MDACAYFLECIHRAGSAAGFFFVTGESLYDIPIVLDIGFPSSPSAPLAQSRPSAAQANLCKHIGTTVTWGFHGRIRVATRGILVCELFFGSGMVSCGNTTDMVHCCFASLFSVSSSAQSFAVQENGCAAM